MLLRTRRLLALVLLVAPALGGSSPLQAAKLDTAKIEEITKLKGAWNEPEGVFKVTAPRTDVKVAVDGWAMPPFMGLTS